MDGIYEISCNSVYIVDVGLKEEELDWFGSDFLFFAFIISNASERQNTTKFSIVAKVSTFFL